MSGGDGCCANLRTRASKERKRLASPPQMEPKMERFFPLEFGVRHTGDMSTAAWVPFKSVRDATRRLSVVQRFYQP